MQTREKFYVTTPIYYVNAKPHLGSLYSTVLADVAARWNALQGKETFMLTGTDEHGQKIAQAAQAVGKMPQQFVDSFIEDFKNTWRAYDIQYNHFVRTTDSAHMHAVQEWIKTLQAKGEIYKGAYQGYYCTPCETFVTEKDITVGQELKPACPSCSRATIYMEEECYFFKLSAYQDRLLAFYEAHPDFVTPRERLQEVISFVKSGLKDLSISRTTITWGIPFPGDARHVCYVWADALNNYLSAVGYADPARTAEFEKWWPADLQVLGKDILRFHAVYWPAFLMAADLAIPHTLLVHGWIKIGEQKMSKSLGNVIDPQHLLIPYGADRVRYYLTRYVATTQDSSFTIEELEKHSNADLTNDLSNLVHRMMTLAERHGLLELVPPAQWGEHEEILRQALGAMLPEFIADMESCLYHRAYAHLWKYIHTVNAYFHAQEPWKVVQQDRARCAMILAATVQALHAIALLALPVMPTAVNKLLEMLGVSHVAGHNHVALLMQNRWNRTFHLVPKEPLFTKLAAIEEPVVVQEPHVEQKQPSYITIDDFGKVELLVGTIIKVDLVPKSDKLYALTVDLGAHGVRQICSGVRKHFKPEDLLNKQGLVVGNLQPRPMMGLTSHGMMLFAEDATGKLQLVTVATVVPNGTKLR